MDDFLSDIQIQNAKKRIWNGMQDKLPERGIGVYQSVISSFRASRDGVEYNRLKGVQAKERLLDMLPEREKEEFNFIPTRRVWAAATLSIFFAFLVIPLLQVPKVAQAATYNTLEVVQGEVLVNGAFVEGEVFVREGDRVHTGNGAMAHIEFVDDSRVTLGPDTSLDILYVGTDLENKAKTEIVLEQLSGRVWAQALNLVEDSYLALNFPEGEVVVNQRASFDLQVNEDEIELQVARNLVEVRASGFDSYEGTLGQGASMVLTEDVVVEELGEEDMEDVWWSFNLAYGKIHARGVEEKYKNEAIERATILPGNPLYVLKTFQETVEKTFALSSEAKEELASKHAENRLDEAQALIEQGDMEAVTEALGAYEETVEENLENTDNEELLAHLGEIQKEVMTMQEFDEGAQLLGESVAESSAVISSDPSEKNEARMLSASQKLHLVPDLIEGGDFDTALAYLAAYQEDSISLLVQLEEVELEDREAVVSDLLEQKLKDLQMLRVISSMLEIEELIDVDAQIYEEMSLMALSLRERVLDRLSGFFTETEYDALLQQDVYERVKDNSDMGEELSEQFEAVEDELDDVVGDGGVVMDVEPVIDAVDPRFDF